MASDSDSSTVLAQVGLCIIGLASQSHIHVLHRGIGYDLSLLPDTRVILGTRLETPGYSPMTSIPGKNASHTPATTIKDAGLTHGLKITIMMLGSMDQELSGMLEMKNEQRRREQAVQDRPSRVTTKVRSPFYCQERLMFAAKLTAVISNSMTRSSGALGRHSDETRTSFLHTYQPSARNLLHPLPTDSVGHIMLISLIFCPTVTY